MTTPKSIKIQSRQLLTADHIESIICLATLIAVDELPLDATVQDANNFQSQSGGSCWQCPYHLTCLAPNLMPLSEE